MKFKGIEHETVVQYSLLFAITVFAAMLRFYKLGEWSFWIDEVYTFTRAKDVFHDLEWVPVSEILIGLTFIFLEVSEWSARLAPALIGILSIPILYFPIKKLFGPVVALLAGLLLAVSPWHLYWSQNSRFYTLLLLFYTLALLYFLIGIEHDNSWYVFISAILLTLAANEHLTALLFIPIGFSYFILLKFLSGEKPAGLRIKNLFLLFLPLMIIGANEIYSYLYGAPVDTMEQITTNHSQSGFYVIITKFLNSVHINPFWLLTSIVYDIGIPLVCLVVFGGLYLLLEKRRKELLLILAALTPVVAILLLSSISYVQDRYSFIALSSWLILGAIIIKEIILKTEGSTKFIILGVLVLLLVDPLSQNMFYFKYQQGNRSDWKEAYDVVKQRIMDGDIVASAQPEVGEYYLGRDVVMIDEIDPAKLIQDKQRVWFVDMGWANPNLQKWIIENCTLIDVKDVHTPIQTMMMRVFLFDPNNSHNNLISSSGINLN